MWWRTHNDGRGRTQPCAGDGCRFLSCDAPAKLPRLRLHCSRGVPGQRTPAGEGRLPPRLPPRRHARSGDFCPSHGHCARGGLPHEGTAFAGAGRPFRRPSPPWADIGSAARRFVWARHFSRAAGTRRPGPFRRRWQFLPPRNDCFPRRSFRVAAAFFPASGTGRTGCFSPQASTLCVSQIPQASSLDSAGIAPLYPRVLDRRLGQVPATVAGAE